MNLFLTTDNSNMPISEAALYAVLSIVMVFVILLIIIGITTLIFKAIGLFELKAELDRAKAEMNAPKATPAATRANAVSLDVNDEDMMAAVLVATIDYQNEIKEDVRLVSVRVVK